MGSPVSAVVADLYKEHIENAIMSDVRNKVGLRSWRRLKDDVFAICKNVRAEGSLRHINTIDSKIQFTSEEEKDGVLNFLDITLTKKGDGGIATLVYRKPTSTDRILQWSSNHPKSAKVAAVDSMVRRLDTHYVEDDNEGRQRNATHH